MDQAAIRRQPPRHRLRIGAKLPRHLARQRQGPPGQHAHLRQGQPLGHPRRAVPLHPVDRSPLHHPVEPRDHPRQRHKRRRPHRIRLLRHGRGAPGPLQQHLSDAALAQRHHIRADLAKGARHPRHPPRQCDDPVPLGVPAGPRIGQAQGRRQPRPHLRSPWPHGRKGPRSTRERHPRNPLPHYRQTGVMSQKGPPPPRHQRAKGRGRRRLSPCPRDHRQVGMDLGQLSQSPDQREKPPLPHLGHPLQPQGQRGVDDVLRGRTPMRKGHELRRIRGLAEGRKERRHRHPVPRHACCHRRRVQDHLLRGPVDEGRSLGRDQAKRPLHPRQGPFDQQHRAQFRRVGEQARGLVIPEQAAVKGRVGGACGHRMSRD